MTGSHFKPWITIGIVLLFVAPPLTNAKPYKGAELRTKVSYLYGRFEVRYKSLQRTGALASFFTYNDDYPNTPWNEIDIEILGRYENDIQFNAITPGTTNHVGRRQATFNPHLDFHTYAFEWTPAYVAWCIDGVEVYRQTAGHIQTLTYPQKIMMNVWIPQYENWVGVWDPKSLPAFAYYDWVSYSSYTPGQGNTGTGKNFTFQWKDDFNSYDAARWAKATHTWNGNATDFVPENIVFKDGMLILCLTDDINLGYQDKISPSLSWARSDGNKVVVRFTEELDPVGAEMPSNYLISGGPTITSVRLLPDGRTIECDIAGMDTALTYSFILLGVNDRATPENKATLQAKPIISSKPLAFPIKINAGGLTTGSYLADQEWNEVVEFGYQDGAPKTYSSSLAIKGTSEPGIYQSERTGLVYYRIRVPNGMYSVTLMMAENRWIAPQQRTFDVVMEGQTVFTALDVFNEAGKNAALNKSASNVQVADGVLDIYFGGSIDQPVLNGIIVERTLTGLDRGANSSPDGFHMYQNYPNPFNSGTNLRFALAKEESVTLRIYDVTGRGVFEHWLGILPAGENHFYWNPSTRGARPLSSGVYYYFIEGTRRSHPNKLVYLK